MKNSNLIKLKNIFDIQIVDAKKLHEIAWLEVECLGRLAQSEEKRATPDLEFPDQIFRRAMVRACYAYLEGMITKLEPLSILIRILQSQDVKISDKKIMINTFVRQGHENRSNKDYKDYRSFKDRSKNTLKSISLITSNKFDLSKHSTEWKLFIDIVQVRHNITHPYMASDMIISNDDYVEILNSVKWFKDVYEVMLIHRLS